RLRAALRPAQPSIPPQSAAVDGLVTEQFFDPQELVVLADAVSPAGRTSLDLAGPQGDGQVGDCRVLRLTAAVAHDGGGPAAARQLDRSDRFAQAPDLVDFDEDAVRHPPVDSLLKALDVGHEQVVAHELHFFPEGFGELLPAFPVVFCAAVFDGTNRVLR